jgi:hypothetical protein
VCESFRFAFNSNNGGNGDGTGMGRDEDTQWERKARCGHKWVKGEISHFFLSSQFPMGSSSFAPPFASVLAKNYAFWKKNSGSLPPARVQREEEEKSDLSGANFFLQSDGKIVVSLILWPPVLVLAEFGTPQMCCRWGMCAWVPFSGLLPMVSPSVWETKTRGPFNTFPKCPNFHIHFCCFFGESRNVSAIFPNKEIWPLKNIQIWRTCPWQVESHILPSLFNESMSTISPFEFVGIFTSNVHTFNSIQSLISFVQYIQYSVYFNPM